MFGVNNKATLRMALAVAAFGAAASANAERWSPIMYSIFGSPGCAVYGLCFQDGHPTPMAGEKFEKRIYAIPKVYGVSLGWWGAEVVDMKGVQAGLLWTRSFEADGIQASLLCNAADRVSGVQAALLGNSAKAGGGLQMGLFNRVDFEECGTGPMVQIGLLNRTADGWWIPLIGWSGRCRDPSKRPDIRLGEKADVSYWTGRPRSAPDGGGGKRSPPGAKSAATQANGEMTPVRYW